MNTYNPLISVIVPIYNVEQYLEECLESLHKQDYPNLEILLINDGSPDNSAIICNKYTKIDRRFHYYYKDNSGLSGARNYALDLCHGDYISFVDSDDIIKEGCYSTLVGYLTKDYDIVQFGYYHGTTIYSLKSKTEHREYEAKNYLINFLLNGPDTVWCRLYSSELFKINRFKEGIIKEDSYIIPSLILDAQKIISIADCLYYYRQREGSIMNSGFTNRQYDTMVVYEQIMRVTEFNKELYSIAAARSVVAMAGLYSQFISDRKFMNEDRIIVKFKGQEYLRIYNKIKNHSKVKFSYRLQILLFSISPKLCSFVLHLIERLT